MAQEVGNNFLVKPFREDLDRQQRMHLKLIDSNKDIGLDDFFVSSKKLLKDGEGDNVINFPVNSKIGLDC